jgi:hypothetical protein
MSSCFLFINDEDASKKISIDELYEKRHQKDLKQLSIFNKILNRIHRRIELTGRTKSKDRHIWFQVPQYLFGEALYDQGHCIAFVVSKLEDNGFHVRYLHPNTLFVSWDHWVPSYVRNEIKKKMGIVVNERGEVVKDGDRGEGEDMFNRNMIMGGNAQMNGPPPPPTSGSKEKNYTPIKQYKPTGNLVYDADIFDKIEKKVSFSL